VEHYETDLVPIIERIISERDRLFERLSKTAGLRPVPSHANFIATETDIEPAKLLAELFKEGILARDVSRYPMLERYVRFSVGTPEENDELVATLEDIFKRRS